MRLALTKSTARLSFAFLGANGTGGKAPRDALASDVSRARLLKNPPKEIIKCNTCSSYDLDEDRGSYHSSKLHIHNCFLDLFWSGSFFFVGRLNCRFRTAVFVVKPR